MKKPDFHVYTDDYFDENYADLDDGENENENELGQDSDERMIVRTEHIARGLGGLLSQAGSVLNATSRHLALHGELVAGELRIARLMADTGEPGDRLALIGAFTSSFMGVFRATSDTLAQQRAHAFQNVVGLLAVGRKRFEVRSYLEHREWRTLTKPSTTELAAREIILSTPGLDTYIQSQTQIPEIWVEPVALAKPKRARRRKTPG